MYTMLIDICRWQNQNGKTVTTLKLSKPMKWPCAHSLPYKIHFLCIAYQIVISPENKTNKQKQQQKKGEKKNKKRSTAFYGSLFPLFFFGVFVKPGSLTTDKRLMPLTMPWDNTECVKYEVKGDYIAGFCFYSRTVLTQQAS